MLNHNPIRICYILPKYDPATSSHFFHIYELLAAASHELDIFLVIERGTADPRALRLPFYLQKFSFPPLRFVELLFVLLRERFRARRYFYTHYSFYGGVASWFVTRLLGGRAYYWNCGMPWLYRRPFLEEAVFRFVLRHTVLVTGTKGIGEAYRRHYGIRDIRVMPNRIMVSRFQSGPGRAVLRSYLGIRPEADVILFVHHLSRRKGAHLLPDIARSVISANKHAMFVIVGAGPERERVQAAIDRVGLAGNVSFRGEVAYRDVIGYFQAADVFLLPSEEEGFPHSLLDAQASGLPYVASDVGGVRDITPAVLQDFVVTPGDAQALSSKLIELLRETPAARAKISDVLKAHVRQYDTLRVVPQFVKLFQP